MLFESGLPIFLSIPLVVFSGSLLLAGKIFNRDKIKEIISLHY